MINTYQTSVAPPPVPPRFWKPQRQSPQPVLIPAQLPSPDNGKPLIRFLVGVVMLHLLLSVGGFIFLFYKEKPNSPENPLSPQRIVGFPHLEQQATTYKTFARMVVKKSEEKTSGHLQWDMDHSVRNQVNYYQGSWLTILEPGDYIVFSRVTFSRGHPNLPLASKVRLRNTAGGEERDMMKAYCSLSTSGVNPHLCTATQQDLFTLQKGNQLSVWVQDPSLVDYEDGATTFGIYKL